MQKYSLHFAKRVRVYYTVHASIIIAKQLELNFFGQETDEASCVWTDERSKNKA